MASDSAIKYKDAYFTSLEDAKWCIKQLENQWKHRKSNENYWKSTRKSYCRKSGGGTTVNDEVLGIFSSRYSVYL